MREREEERAARRAPYRPRGRGARQRGAGDRHGEAASMATVGSLWRQEGADIFLKNPLALLKLIANWSSSPLVQLNDALNHFYKFGENSQRLPITCSTSTKIGLAKLKVLSNIC